MVEKITFTDEMQKASEQHQKQQQEQEQKIKRNGWLIALVLFCFLAYGCVDLLTVSDGELAEREAQLSIEIAKDKEAKEKRVDKTTESQIVSSDYDSSLVRNYEIIDIENDPWMGAVRKQYWILVPSDISEAETKATFMQLIMDETSKNPDIDAICIFAYDRKVDVDYGYTIGTVDWCPNGNWNVPSEIAKSNDRSSYEYVFKIARRVTNSTVDKPTEFDYKIYDYFKISYDAAWDEIDLSDPYAIVDEDSVMQDVAKHFGITAEEADASYMKVVEYQYQ